MRSLDPRQPAVIAWLLEQKPEDELAARMAMRAVFRRCRDDPAWSARIEELSAKAAPNAKLLARILCEASRIEAMIGGSQAHIVEPRPNPHE